MDFADSQRPLTILRFAPAAQFFVAPIDNDGPWPMPAYSGKAQPYLDAIAEGVFTSHDVRD